jgi:hypothetical protein
VKYWPVTSASSGADAKRTSGFDPRFGPMRKGCDTVERKRSAPRVSAPRPKPDRTGPGWQALAVTPVPSRRRASSVVNKMLASFDSLYAVMPT